MTPATGEKATLCIMHKQLASQRMEILEAICKEFMFPKT
jgi:hypothetical protein